jgi:Ca-activated chloride channel homolog
MGVETMEGASMNLAAPYWLWLLPVALVWWLRRSRQVALGVPSLLLWNQKPDTRGRWLWVIPVLQALGVAALLMAMARPQRITSETVENHEGIAIELLVDTSSSMDMKMDLDTRRLSRIDMAKELVAKFILGDGDELKGRSHDMIGLITFARYADTRSPLTSGHAALAQIVRGITVQNRPNEDGTAYGDALALAAARLHHLNEVEPSLRRAASDDIASKVIILLTDGENNSGSHLPEEAGGMARAWGVKVYAISLSDTPVTPGFTEMLSASDALLNRIAHETGGIFRQAYDFKSLQAVYQEIDRLERTKLKLRNVDQVHEVFVWPLAFALLAWIAAFLLEATWLRSAP